MVCSDPAKMICRITTNHFSRISTNLERHWQSRLYTDYGERKLNWFLVLTRINTKPFDGTSFASNSAKNWESNCPLGPHSSTALLLLHSSILDSTQSYNPPQLSSAHRCAGTVFDMESLKKSNKGCKIMEGIFQQYGTKWKEVFEIKPPLQFSQIWFKSLDGAEN